MMILHGNNLTMDGARVEMILPPRRRREAKMREEIVKSEKNKRPNIAKRGDRVRESERVRERV